MNHSQSLPSIKSMYQLVVGRDNTWGLQSYNVNKKYEDPIQLKLQRQLKDKKKSAKKLYITRKGHYLEDLAKQNKTPGPGTYPPLKLWTQQEKKKSYGSDKKTYIDQIFAYQKKNKFPASNAYQILQSQQHLKTRIDKLKQKKIVLSNKLTYIDTCQYQSLITPGPGNYNPHEIKIKLRENHFKPQEIRKMHAQKQKNKKQICWPDMNTYNPTSASYQLFEKRTIFPKKFQQRKNGWGTQSKGMEKSFNKHEKQNKKELPGPGQYNTMVNWAGKTKTENSSNYFKIISTGINKSIYY